MHFTVVMYTLHAQKCVREIFERMFILKAIAKAYNGVSLILRIVIGLAIGVAGLLTAFIVSALSMFM